MLMNWFGMKLIPDFKRNLNSIIYQHRACNIHIFLALTLTLPSSINAYISTSFPSLFPQIIFFIWSSIGFRTSVGIYK